MKEQRDTNVMTEPIGGSRELFSAIQHGLRRTENERIAELESENSRLHRLVAELLLKNQQLRDPR